MVELAGFVLFLLPFVGVAFGAVTGIVEGTARRVMLVTTFLVLPVLYAVAAVVWRAYGHGLELPDPTAAEWLGHVVLAVARTALFLAGAGIAYGVARGVRSLTRRGSEEQPV